MCNVIASSVCLLEYGPLRRMINKDLSWKKKRNVSVSFILCKFVLCVKQIVCLNKLTTEINVNASHVRDDDHILVMINPNYTGIFCTMIILGGGGWVLGGPLQISAPKGPIAAKFGTHLRNCAKRKTSVIITLLKNCIFD